MNKLEFDVDDQIALARHATQIYTAMSSKLPLTDQNIKGARCNMETAIEHAELFHLVLKEKGYKGGTR